MKKILIALAMVVIGMSALQQARGADVSVDYFYDNLSGGNWIDVEGYGYGWQPDVAVNDSNWRPYADGYWAYTDDGWTWISYEDFGWATYHYGRWASLSDYGWVWFPGEDLDWGPAWVSWRTGGDYVGWAPLPPRGPGIVYEGRPIGPQVDIEFDIGPEYYNFCEARYIGEPVLRNYIAPPGQNVTYINNTVNVTNITVQNNVVCNYGPSYEVLSAHSARPIQRLNIERQSAANLSAAAKSGALTKVQGNKLLVAAPQKLAKAPPAAKPAVVKTKVAQPKLNRGWAGVPDEAQLKQKIKTENPKNIPPPTGAATRGGGSPPPAVGTSPRVPTAAGAPPISPGPKSKPARVPPGIKPAPPGPGAAGVSPVERSKPRGRLGVQPGATMPPAPGETAPQSERGKVHDRPGAQPGRAIPPGPDGAVLPPEQGKPRGKSGKQGQDETLQGKEKTRTELEKLDQYKSHGRPGVQPGNTIPPGPGEAVSPSERGLQLQRFGTPPPGASGTGEARGGKEKEGQSVYGQPAGRPRDGAPAPAERRQGQSERGKKKGEGTPPPRPY